MSLDNDERPCERLARIATSLRAAYRPGADDHMDEMLERLENAPAGCPFKDNCSGRCGC